MATIEQSRAKSIIRNFSRQKILVLGDIMVDKYLWGRVSRISPEAPVPVVEIEKDTSCLGGAGNVWQNLKSLGASPMLSGIVGRDTYGEWIQRHITDSRGVFSLPDRPTSLKTRIIAHHQQVVRVDQENKIPIPQATLKSMTAYIEKQVFQGIFISDYNKGVISRSLMKHLLPWAQTQGMSVFVDPKVENISLYSQVTLLTPNHHEAEKIAHQPCRTVSEVETAGQKILERTGTEYLIIKRGEQGMTVFAKDHSIIHMPTIAKEVFDVTGAGDTVIATAGLALLSGASIREAALLANCAAGIVVGKIGTASLTTEELIDSIKE
jgi:rfaE bifunctional protein kinase chain/domain